MNMKWRHCIPYAAILSKRNSKACPIASNLASISSSASLPTTEGMDNKINDDSNHRSIGGGAINEKPRLYQNKDEKSIGGGDVENSWNPRDNLSHMLHALVGLDRYPNYLSRFGDVSDMNALENALESRLSDVRRQRSEILERRNGIQQLVRKYILTNNGNDSGSHVSEEVEGSDNSMLWSHHPSLSPPKTWLELRARNILKEQAFKVAYKSISKSSLKKKQKAKSQKSQKQMLPTVEEIVNAKAPVDLDPALLEDWMCQEMFDVYSFPLLTNEFCSLVRKTLRELSALAETDEFSHLQLGRRVIDLDTIGLGWVTDLLFHLFIQPISRHLFSTSEKLADCGHTTGDVECDSETIPILDWRQGYVAGYSANPTTSKGATRHRLVPHTDDSEVTLNCCLGEENFEGGNVEFYGLRGTPEEGQLVGKVHRPNVGTALLHSGRHLHAVSNVSSGDRYALIVWARSWRNLRSNTCPCCWLNRRQDSTCICDKRWN
mmetsp:Transcript_24043/g.50341  ORF Transcript_24043/g.50341 Transcript_24043/m.50341 type:complete len:491 (-) Transcript_24043:129-1601(-)